jgi:tRNA(fMet)-specific endonuclease VapC
VIVVDTSVLIDTFCGELRSADRFREWIAANERMVLPAIVLYEWLRGPRAAAEIEAQEALLPSANALPFDAEVAAIAANLYRRVARPRGREIDLAIAAHAMALGASVWTINPKDFAGIPGLAVHS